MKNKSKKFSGFDLVVLGSKILLISFFVSGCSVAEKRTAEQQIVTPDKQKQFAERLKKNLTVKYSVIRDFKKEKVLSKTIATLIAATPAYSSLGTPVVYVANTDRQFAVPGLGNEIFISLGMLNTLKYENELAFVLATQLALLQERIPATALANLQGQEFGESLISLPTATPPLRRQDYLEHNWFEPGGFYDFGLATYLKAERDAIIVCHNAKYDPRGAVTYIQRVEPEETAKIMPEQEDRLSQAREEVAKLSPLRDPIVKSGEFDLLLKSVQIRKAKKK